MKYLDEHCQLVRYKLFFPLSPSMDPVFKLYSSGRSLAAVNDGDLQWLVLSAAPEQWTEDLLERFGNASTAAEKSWWFGVDQPVV